MSKIVCDSRHDPSWFIAERWQHYDGEQRANYLRILSVGTFYTIHLLNYYRPIGLFDFTAQPSRIFHQAVTVLAAAWILMALAVDMSLRQRFFPRWLPFGTTACDLLFLTSILCLGKGQLSPLVIGYVLIIIIATLRVSLRLVRATTAGALFGYLFVLAVGKWPETFGAVATGRLPRYSQVMTLLAIAISGIMLGQLIRQVRHMAETYAAKIKAHAKDPQA